MKSISETRAWLQERFQPVVLVSATSGVETICQTKNGLSIIDILRPFAALQHLNAPLRVGDASFRVQDLRLRFHGFNTLGQPKPEVIDEHLKEVLLASSARHATTEPFENLIERIQSGNTPDVTPWFTEYRDEFIRLLSFGDHESIDHPVACIFVIPSDVAEPLKHMEALIQQTPAPDLMKRDLMLSHTDPLFPKHYVLLHDGYFGGEAAWKKANDNLALMDACYGANHCTLLRINTGRGDQASMGAPPGFFTACRHACLPGGGAGEPEARPPEPPQGLGAHLASADLETVAQFLVDFASKTLLPKLEDRINRLNTSITATRRGLRNRLTRLWKGGASETTTQEGPYGQATIEAQMRQLADLAFLLRSYDFACTTYRLAAADYLGQHNFKWYAGAEEMIGLCCALDPALEGSDPAKYFTRAYDNYAKTPGRTNRMLATRAMLFSAAYQTAAGRHLGANLVLMRAHYDEENARAALLLEQAAYALLHLKTPSVRKFAFHMVLAGLRYHSGQRRLSVNAYRQVLAIYQGRQWAYIEEHLSDLLGKMLREQDPQACALHFFDLLRCTYRTAQLQAHYLNQFLDALKAFDASKQIAQQVAGMLHLPTVNTGDIRVIFSDQRCYGNAPAAALPDDTWGPLEAALAGPLEAPGGNWLTATKQSIDHEEYNTSIAGEDISVDVEFRNPLQVKLKVSKVQLLCEFQPIEAGDAQRGPPEPSASPPSASSLAEHVTLSSDDFTLHPSESLVGQLRATPLRPGWLRVTGVRWLLNDTVAGQATFDAKGRRRKRPKGDRPAQQKHYPPHRRLLFSIIPSLPRLEVQADTMPTSLYQGELVKVAVTLRNTGRAPIGNLQLATDSADIAARPGDTLPADATPSTSGRGSLEASAVVVGGSGSGRVLVYGGSSGGGGGAELGPGERQQWEVWLHPQQQGLAEFKLVWYYEPRVEGTAVRYRTLRMAVPVEVAALLRVVPTLQPSPKDLFRYLLRLDVTCFKDREAVQVRQISCSSGGRDLGWRLSHLNRSTVAEDTERPCYHSVCPAISVSPGESSTIFFNLAPPASSQPHEEAPSPPSMPYDPFSDPLHHFHSTPAPSATPAHSGASSAAASHPTPTPSTAPEAPPSAAADPPVDVLIIWQIPNSRQMGGPGTTTRYGALQLRDCCRAQAAPLRLMLQGQPMVQHNFRKQAMCTAPLELSIRNCSCLEAAVTVEAGPGWSGTELVEGAWHAAPPPAPPGPLAAGVLGGPGALGVPGSLGGVQPSPPSTPSGSPHVGPLLGPTPSLEPTVSTFSHGPPLLAGLPPSNDYLWGGRTRVTIRQLAPGAITTVPLRVCVFRPGTFLLTDYRATAAFPDGSSLGQAVAKGDPYMLKVEAGQ